MLSALYKVGSSLMLGARRQDLIAQNLAGAGLCGFKGRHLAAASFQDRLAGRAPVASGAAAGASPDGVVTDFTQGGLVHTNRALDMAIVGPGFFQVRTPDGATVLTRNGTFTLSADGFLVTQEGHKVMGDSGPLQLNPTDIAAKLQVREDGSVTVPGGLTGAPRTVGVLAIGTVAEPDRMTRLSANYYLPAEDQTVEPATEARVCNGYQEQSNVSPVRQMAAMIQSLREFESGHRMVQTLNELAREADRKTG